MKNLILSFFVVLISCTNEDISKQISVESKIVVEGSIEEGGYAEDDEVYMTEEELEDFLANGGEVEYL